MSQAAPTSDQFRFRSAALSDKGAVRKLNEDSFIVRDDICLWAVADGVGGHEAGDVASRLLVEALGEIAPPASGKSFLEAVTGAIKRANAQMLSHASRAAAGRKMGSTIVCLIAFRDHVACLWVGDSRIYRLRAGELKRLSKDHSLVQEMLDRGELTPEEARHHPQSNVITRAVGAQAEVAVDVVRELVLPGDRFLLCSDGLVGMVADEEIQSLAGGQDLDRAAGGLMALALERGARDNVTLILIEAVAGGAAEDQTLRRPLGGQGQ